MRYRVTSGHYVKSGISFKITDDSLRAGNAHRALKESWVRQTSFNEIPEYIEETVLPVPGGLFSLGLLRPPALPIPRPVRVQPERHVKLDPLPVIVHIPEVEPRGVREFPEVCAEVPTVITIFTKCTYCITRTRDPPLPRAGGSYFSRRLRERRVRGYLFTPRLGSSSSGADPSSRARSHSLRDVNLPLRPACSL